MIFGLLVTLYIFAALLLALLILVQKGKGSMGLGNLGGGTQLLFGGSGGQDLFQKITWLLGAIFIGGSLVLSIMKTKQYQKSRYLIQTPQPIKPSNSMQQTAPQQAPESIDVKKILEQETPSESEQKQ